MDILTLCNKTKLQPEIKTRVLEFADNFDFNTIDKQLKDFLIYEKMNEVQLELQSILGDDEDNIKILTCMLKASADAYEIYKAKGISDKIYFDTMKCYPRFIDETYKMTGKLYFDRYWWTTRQAGCHLFRIGELEYEMKHIDDKIVIGIHIPSDADFSPAAVDKSLMKAKEFFVEYYPNLANAEYRCHSWLLDSHLKGMLNENSNIISFQNRFEIFDVGEADTEFIEWLYNSKPTDYSALAENTSLQKNMKRHLISGGVIRNAYGRLK
ncbi:MAG: acyltransferase domain-containing protein [Eubacterium sp.]